MNRPLLTAAIGVVLAIIAIALNFVFLQEESGGKPETPKKAVETARTAPDEKTLPPTFDVVRVNPQGEAVIAGRAAPGAAVVILVNGEPIGEVLADGRGEWVFVPDKPLPPGNLKLSLVMRIKGIETPSASFVVLAVPKGAEKPLAVKIDKGGSTVLQKPGNAEEKRALTVDAVDYGENGTLNISGRADPGSRVQLYLNNTFIGRTKAGSEGMWRMIPTESVAPGLYTLRADSVDRAGRVLARVEFPFSRAEPIKDISSKTVIVVQPGNSLWRLARRKYGSGFDYTVIYKANKEQIKDPNVIYPGQVFSLPQPR